LLCVDIEHNESLAVLCGYPQRCFNLLLALNLNRRLIAVREESPDQYGTDATATAVAASNQPPNADDCFNPCLSISAISDLAKSPRLTRVCSFEFCAHTPSKAKLA
jgi:hypothetical protein